MKIKAGLYTHREVLNGLNLKGPEDAHMSLCAASICAKRAVDGGEIKAMLC